MYGIHDPDGQYTELQQILDETHHTIESRADAMYDQYYERNRQEEEEYRLIKAQRALRDERQRAERERRWEEGREERERKEREGNIAAGIALVFIFLMLFPHLWLPALLSHIMSYS